MCNSFSGSQTCRCFFLLTTKILITCCRLLGCRKLRREVVEKELTAFDGRQAQGQFRPIDKVEVEAKIKEFVRHSIRRLHASRAAGAQEGLAVAGCAY